MKKLRPTKLSHLSKVTELENGEAKFKDWQPGFRLLAISHCILTPLFSLGSVILLTLNVQQYKRVQICTGRMSGYDCGGKKRAILCHKQIQCGIYYYKIPHKTSQWFSTLAAHVNHFWYPKNHRCQELTPDSLESQSPGLEYRDLHFFCSKSDSAVQPA